MNHVLQPQEEHASPGEPQVLGLEDESTQEALDALSSGTARELFGALYDEPQTPSELHREVGTSLQNVHYHVEKLEDAGLIREVGTRFSEKGNEMSVYAPVNQAVVFMAGDTESRSLLRRALGRLVGALALLAGGSLLVGELFGQATQSDTGARITAESTTAGDAAATAASTPDPALVFFVGGLFVLSLLGAWWGYRELRHRSG